MATKIQVRRDTAANWTSANPTLSDGEIGYETDTGYMKIGDGTTAWSSLSYFTPGAVDGDNNTTYTIGTTQSGSDANITLAGSDATNDTISLVAGTNLSLTVAGDNITAAVDNDLSNYDNSTSAFLTNSTLSLTGKSIGELSDVNGSMLPSNGDVLAWDAGNTRWNATTQSVPTSIDDLSDVDTTTSAPTTGNILVWSTAGAGEWVTSGSFSGGLGNTSIDVTGPLDLRWGTVYGKTLVRNIDPYQSNYEMGSNNGGIFFVRSQNVNIDWNFSDYEPSLAMRKMRIIINNNLVINGPAQITGTVSSPTTTPGDTVIINDTTVTLTGTTLQDAIDDINAAAIADVTANNFGGETIATATSTGIGTINFGDSILINGNPVDFSGSTNPFTLASDINNYGYTGFTASVSGGSTLVITADRSVNLTLAENGGTVLPELGLTAGTTNYVPGTDLIIEYAPTDHTDYADYRARSYLDIGNGTANADLGLTNGDTQSIDFDGCPGISITNFKIRGTTTTVRNSTGGDGFPAGSIGGWDIYDLECVAGAGGTDIGNGTPTQWFVKHWNETPTVVTGDLTGSVFADDSTLLVDGVSGSIPAANLTGALPALDGSALTNISGLGIQDVVDDTTPQLGGNLDLNSNDITGTGNVSITGNATITGNVKTNGDNADFILENTNVNANEEVFGNIIATTGSVEYGKVVFKAGPDSYTDNGEVNWITRIQGSDVTVFEIKGSTLSKSGIVFNPTGNAEVDFYMAGATDGQLLYVDAGDDKVGIGKLPTQGKLDVDGDAYADNFVGGLRATGTAPASATDTGTAGDIRYDADYIYICVATDTWKRVAISTW